MTEFFVPLAFPMMLILLSGDIHAAPTILRVSSYGATGNGVTDDRPAIQKALNDARLLGNATIYFDPGVYNLVSATSSYGQLALTDWNSSYHIDLVGNNSTLQTAQTSGSVLFAEGYWQNSTIQGLTFQSSHPITLQSTAAITFSGGGQNAIQNWTIAGNTFRNFSRHIAISGVNGLRISGNTFEMNAGRDSGTATNPEPNVAIWMFNNGANGTSSNIRVISNHYNGCSGGSVIATVSRSCGDGFLYGQGSGVVAQENTINGFSFEAIYLYRDSTNGVPPLIQLNSIDGTVVNGDSNHGGQWGIRCDANNALITRNNILNAANGIVIYGAELASDVLGSTISNNVVVSRGSNQPLRAGIQVTAASAMTISNNTITFSSLPTGGSEVPFIYASGLVNRFSNTIKITGNQLTSSLTQNISSGVYLQFTQDWTITDNTIAGLKYGLHTMNLVGAISLLSSFENENSLLGLTAKPTLVSNGWFN